MSYDMQIFLLAAALIIDIIITGYTYKELKRLKRLKRIEKYFDMDEGDYGENIE